MTIITILILCSYLITCHGYFKLTLAEPAVQDCYNEHPKAVVVSLVILALLWPIVCLVVYFIHGLKK